MTWHRVRSVFRWTAIIALSLAAMTALTGAVATLPDLIRHQFSDPRTLTILDDTFSRVPRPLLSNERYSLWADVSECRLSATCFSYWCSSCGQSPPNHAPDCPYRLGIADPMSRIHTDLTLPGFRWLSGDSGGERFIGVEVSLWLIFAVLAAYPTTAFVRGPLRRHRRRKRGLCEKCGYDLRASPQRCPECGTPQGNTARITTALGE